ncbi:MAG: hypothetical protein SGPRY_002351 [Prymnesium sp.]
MLLRLAPLRIHAASSRAGRLTPRSTALSIVRHASDHCSGCLSPALAARVLQRAPEAVVLADAKGIIGSWNDGAKAMFGYSSQEAIGTDLSELIVPQNHRKAHDAGMPGGPEWREYAPMVP